MISRRVFLGRAGEIAAFSAVAGTGLSQLACNGRGSTRPRPQSGMFDLEVTIWGLCLFWKPDQPQTTQHVLLVKPDPNQAQKVEQHFPRVYYDAKYDCNVEGGKFWRTVPLEGTLLDLSAFKGTESTIKLPDDLLDISPFTPPLPDPKVANPPNLACRVTLPPGVATDGGYPIKGFFIKPPGEPPKRPEERKLLTLASKVVWTIHGIRGTELSWKLNPLNPCVAGCGVEQPPPLKPSSDRKIELYISNVVLKEIGHEPGTYPDSIPCNLRVPHFTAFFDLYTTRGPRPELINTRAGCPPMGTPYTCLPSGGH